MLQIYLRCLKSTLRPISRGFPYKFNQHPLLEESSNDLDSSEGDENEQKEELATHYHSIIEGLFGSEVFAGFSDAYRNLLLVFKEKDSGHLKTLLEPLLFDSTRIPELQLIAPDSHIKCRVVDLEVVFGVLFDRRATPLYKQMVCIKTEYNQIECHWYSEKYRLPNR